MRRFLPILLVAALVGCGSVADKNEYVNSVNQAQAALTASLSAISPAGEPARIAADLDQGGKAIDAAAADLEAITPPDDAKHAHGRIVAGLEALAGTLREAADAARSSDQEKMVEILTGIQKSKGARELEAAQKELVANGYRFQEA